MVWTSVPPNSYGGILRPDVLVLGGGALGGDEGSARMNGTGALMEETPQSFPAPSTGRTAVCDLEEDSHPNVTRPAP